MARHDPYGDILEDQRNQRVGSTGTRRLADTYPQVPAVRGLEVVHRRTGIRGKIYKFNRDLAVIEDRKGGHHQFENHPGTFMVNGDTVMLIEPPRPSAATAATRRSASGAVVAQHQPAKVAKASRIWVEGDHDARFVERVWGDDLRELGIVVEPMGGIDDLHAAIRRFGPSDQRRLAIIVDHLVPGSKETRLTENMDDPNVLILGHPFVDIWQCVRPKSMGIAAWPEVPRGEDWKTGICNRLGWGTPQEGWRRVISAVDSFVDLEPELVGAVETALDFLADFDEIAEMIETHGDVSG